MICKKWFKVPAQSNCASLAFLFLRVVAGLAFMYHGWPKIQAPMAWAPPDSGFPAVLLLLAAISEFGGGLAWVLGLLTPLASFGLACTMFVATLVHAVFMKDPFVNMTGGSAYELPLMYLAIAVLFMFAGPGKFSLDYKLFGKRD